jgi:hypothetical protein
MGQPMGNSTAHPAMRPTRLMAFGAPHMRSSGQSRPHRSPVTGFQPRHPLLRPCLLCRPAATAMCAPDLLLLLLEQEKHSTAFLSLLSLMFLLVAHLTVPPHSAVPRRPRKHLKRRRDGHAHALCDAAKQEPYSSLRSTRGQSTRAVVLPGCILLRSASMTAPRLRHSSHRHRPPDSATTDGSLPLITIAIAGPFGELPPSSLPPIRFPARRSHSSHRPPPPRHRSRPDSASHYHQPSGRHLPCFGGVGCQPRVWPAVRAGPG